MDCRDQAEQPHGEEQTGAKPPVFSPRKGGSEESEDDGNANDGDSCQVDDVPGWGALENVVHWREIGGEYHDSDPGKVHLCEYEG